MLGRPRIIDVERKPRKCPVCGSSVVDIIYGTGDMNEAEYLLLYRRDGIMGGDNIPRRPPIWACSCGCKRFRKVNFDGTDAEVKVKMLNEIRPKPLTLIDFESENVEKALNGKHPEIIHHYKVDIVTEYVPDDDGSVGNTNLKDLLYEVENMEQVIEADREAEDD